MSDRGIVRDATAADRSRVAAFLAERLAAQNARLGELVDATGLPAIVAEDDGHLAGVLTWLRHGSEVEIHTLHTAISRTGVGTALLDAVRARAHALGCDRLWLVTTNDNLDALRFYQRRGFRLVAVHPGAVDRSRATLKPAIPILGNHDIPIRDELELDSPVDWPQGGASSPPDQRGAT